MLLDHFGSLNIDINCVQFPDMIHALKPNPKSHIQEAWRIMDFFSHVPESCNMFTFLFDDIGIPADYRHMEGFGVHTFKVRLDIIIGSSCVGHNRVFARADAEFTLEDLILFLVQPCSQWCFNVQLINKAGKETYVKFHWKPTCGVKNLLDDEAVLVGGANHSHATQDLYDSIAAGNFPEWKLMIQTMNPADENKFEFDPLDDTKIWPEDRFPLQVCIIVWVI